MKFKFWEKKPDIILHKFTCPECDQEFSMGVELKDNCVAEIEWANEAIDVQQTGNNKEFLEAELQCLLIGDIVFLTLLLSVDSHLSEIQQVAVYLRVHRRLTIWSHCRSLVCYLYINYWELLLFDQFDIRYRCKRNIRNRIK